MYSRNRHKTAFLLLLLFFLSTHIFTQTLPDEETSLEDTNPDEETILDWQTFFDEKNFPAEEIFYDEEFPLDEETFIDEESILEEPPIDEAAFLDAGFLPYDAPQLIIEAPKFEIRSFDTVFPNLSPTLKMTAMSNQGLRHYFLTDKSTNNSSNDFPIIIPNPDLEIDLLGSVMKTNPSHIIEALLLMPFNERELDLLDIYNALGKIENIKNHSVTTNNRETFIFTESTRIENTRSRTAIPDPTPAEELPFSETMYVRLKEITFGNLFLRADISISLYGITYSMTNFADVRYFLIPIMRAERFVTIIYLEPVREGMLIYSVSGFYLPGLIADRVNLTGNINRRIEVFIKWITAGLRE